MDLKPIKQFLRLKRPIKIILKDRANKKMRAGYWGLYAKGKLDSHLIHIYLGKWGNGERSLQSLIAHELIHAWQEECGLTEIHGPQFARMAKEIEDLTGIKEIYLPEYDT